MSEIFDYGNAHLHFKEIDSTNSYARRLIDKQRREGSNGVKYLLISADMQTAGRGRSGKSFSSLAGNGIYMTVMLRVDRSPESCMLTTPAAAVGAVEALEAAGSQRLGIKWVNDLFSEDKKVSGILTEAVFDRTGKNIEYILIGIGINIDADIASMPEDAAKVAGSISGLNESREELMLHIAESISCRVYESFDDGSRIMRIYRERSILLGRQIVWSDRNGRHIGIAEDINDMGNLVVTENGHTVTLRSGEVSVRRT